VGELLKFTPVSTESKTTVTALFINMRTLKFKSQQTNAFFATVNQMFGGPSQLPTAAEHAVIKSNRRVQFRQHSRKLGGAAEHPTDGSEKRICRFRMLLKSAVIACLSNIPPRNRSQPKYLLTGHRSHTCGLLKNTSAFLFISK